MRAREARTPQPAQAAPEIRAHLEGLLGIPFADGNEITALRNGREIFPAMLDAIERAQHTVELVTFIYWTGRIAQRMAETLARKAREAVQVRVVLDAFGAAPMSSALLEQMTEGGVQIRWFRPLKSWKAWKASHRTHRKVLVVDGAIAFTGGVGIAQEWEGDARDPSEWRDTHFRIRGPAVLGLRAAFFGNWAETDRSATRKLLEAEPLAEVGPAAIQVVRSTACFGWSDIATVLDSLISLAQHRVRISTAYFAPDEPWGNLLTSAVDRGIEVEVLIPGPHTDKRISELAGADQIGHLLEAGVRFFRFQPTMLHSKILLVDNDLVAVGSANFNQRSILKDDEIALVVIDAALAATLHAHFEEDLARSDAVKPTDFRTRGPIRRLRELIARPFRSNV